MKKAEHIRLVLVYKGVCGMKRYANQDWGKSGEEIL